MISPSFIYSNHRAARLLTVCVLSSIFLAACEKKDTPDYCGNHILLHADHLNTLATLSINLSDDGQLFSELRVPKTIFDPAGIESRLVELTDQLRQSQNIFSLQADNTCENSAVRIDSSASSDSITASYLSLCGADNQLGQVDIGLFDIIPELDETQVTITTPAVQKRFVISRQCKSALFRFD